MNGFRFGSTWYSDLGSDVMGVGRESLWSGKKGRDAEDARSLKSEILKKGDDDEWKCFCSVLLVRKRAVLQILCHVFGGKD